MDNEFSARGSGVLLFDEDFDLPPPELPPPEPEIIEPVFSAAELEAARETAALESRDIALAEAAVSARAMAHQALKAIHEQMRTARSDAEADAEQSAEALARLLLHCFATALPALSARHGAAEAAAVLRGILPVLRREPRITVRINPHLMQAMTAEIGSHDPDLAARVRLVATDAMALGDVQVDWENGSACRDAKSLWGQIENILAPAGLLTSGPTVKETALVD
jgi:flagellar biosynthesis/type III secretory pathway protein FliH